MRRAMGKLFFLAGFACVAGVAFYFLGWEKQMPKTASGRVLEVGQILRRPALQERTKRGKEEEKVVAKVALTFDDGPHPTWTPKLLDGLKRKEVLVTFFLIGERVQAHPNLVKRMKKEGHLLGGHTYHHVNLKQVSKEEALREVASTNELIERITGEKVSYVRPPYGEWKKGVEQAWQLIPVLWKVDSMDWLSKNIEQIVQKVVTETGDGDIILLHDCYSTSVEATFRIIDRLRAKGYEFVTIDQLLE